MPSRSYFAHVVPGMEPLAEDELRAHGAVVTRILRRFDERTSLVRFDSDADSAALLDLRSTEDVFAEAVELKDVPTRRPGTAAIRAALAGARELDIAVTLAQRARPRHKGKPTFRVIARKAGEHAYRRIDVQRAVELGIHDRFPTWQLVEDDAQLEIWAQLVERLLLVGVRLSDNTMRQRRWRTASLPAALKPTIAHGLVMLSAPHPDDVFLDPMCGSGTIPIERALAGRYRLILAGDVHPDAVAATRENVGPRHQPIEIHVWDARALPLDDSSVSAIVTNLPFGKQIGTGERNRALYPALLDEWVRVLRTDGRMVLLTSEVTLLRRVLDRHPSLQLTRRLRLLVRGQEATAHVVRSTGPPV